MKPKQPTRSMGNSMSLDQPPPPNAMATYASYLKSVYLRQKLPTYGKFPHSPSRRYTNLASVKKEPVSKAQADAFTRATIHDGIDDVKRKKEPITMKEIAVVKKGVWPGCILVEGVPGVGKSTFAWKMCRQWGKGKILRDYKLVVLLSLRDKKVREATQVCHLFHFYNSEVQEEVAEEVKRSGGSGVLLLFEGYDELPETLRTQDSLFLDIICRKELPRATVLITSRPSASGFLYEKCKDYLSQHIEILGFTSENVQSYLESTCGKDCDLLSGIQKYLQCYPHIRTMMYVPLNAAIVVEVYRTSKKDQSVVPRTMTQLYECLVRSLLRRYLNDHPVHGKRKWRICTFDDLPQDVYKHLSLLGKVAYEGITNDRQVIFDNLPEDFVTLGLMQCVPELYVDKGAAVSHSFLHLTVQEFMAAFHLSRNPMEGQLYDRTSKHRMVMRFLAGLTGLEDLTIKPSHTGELKLDLYCLQMMFEAQRVADILEGSEFGIVNGNWSRFDYFVLGYCIAHSNSSWEVQLGCSVEGFEVEELVNGALEHPGQSRGRISKFSIFYCYYGNETISSDPLKYLLKLPKHMLLSSLEELNIEWNQISAEDELISLLQQTTALKELTILIGDGMEALETKCQALASCVRTNDTLQLLSLIYIDLESVKCLAGSLCENTTLQVLNMKECTVGVDGATALGKALTINTSLQQLNVRYCDINSDGACQLANALLVNNSLQRLYMAGNSLGSTGAIALAEALTVNTALRTLEICDSDIDLEGVCRMAGTLHTNSMLQELNLSGNPIGVTGAIALAEALTVNTSLKMLDIRESDIDSEGACRLAGALHNNTSLQELDLAVNPIGDTGATALAEALAINTSLRKLYIGDRSVGEQGTHKVMSSLAQNTTLEVLGLRYEYVHDQVISSYPVRDTIKII